MTQENSGLDVESDRPGGHTVLWLIVGPTVIIAAVGFYLFGMADDGIDLLPEAPIGAGVGAAFTFFLYGNDRPDPHTLAKARWRWRLAAIPIAIAVSGRWWTPSVEVIFLGFLGGFLTLFVIIVGINMVRDRRG